jgi:single-strand DNA-binding protein
VKPRLGEWGSGMFDTVIAVVGNALTMPEWRRTERTNALVANFKIASTSRRYDRLNNRWIDGDSLRLRVTCWRRLAEGVVASVKVGDPVVVTGRLYTREWSTEDGQRRTMYELEAIAVGHDLSRGLAMFKRGRANPATSEVDDADADTRVAGEMSEAMPELNERSAALASAEFGEEDFFGSDRPDSGAAGPGYDPPAATDVEDPFAEFADDPGVVGDGPVEADPSVGGAADDESGVTAVPSGTRTRRGRGRVPVTA